MKPWIQTIAALVLLSASLLASGQEPELVELEVKVTTISGTSVYLDSGRSAGLRAGDPVRFTPLGSTTFELRIDAVSRLSAQADAGEHARSLRPGDRGVARIPRSRFEASASEPAAAGSAREVPAHPPWTSAAVEWDTSTPLLAAAESEGPEGRESRISGRIYNTFESTWDKQGADRRYESNRVGLDLRFDNPFARADGIRVRVEAYERSTAIEGEPEDRYSEFTIDRLSYFRGGQRGKPQRYEVGRFLPLEFAEFGILDGAEFSQRLGSGSVVGTSVGLLPEPDEALTNGDDFQASAFYRHSTTVDDRWSLAAGYQKTWHKGHADRDLLVVKGDYLVNSRISLFGTAWVDFYDSTDMIKTSDVELTQLNVNGTYRTPAGHGASLFFTRLRFPELLREEFRSLTADQLLNNRSERISASVWRRVSSTLRLNLRIDRWEDQDGSGENGEIRADMRDYIYEDGSVSLSLFRIGGAFRSGIGGRISASKALHTGFASVSLDSTRYDRPTLLDQADELLDHGLRASYDWSPAGWDVSLYAEDRFGDSLNALTLGFRIQKRF